MNGKVLISICIPAYKRSAFLQRLLNSIEIQTLRDFEVIVTDDSPDNSVQLLCQQFHSRFPLHYYRNEKAMGTPENWNEAIRRASGKWIKLMHDDDWFRRPDSLLQFAKAVEADDHDFVFAAYADVNLHTKQEQIVWLNNFRKRSFLQEPATLLSKNIIGPPSVIMHKNNGAYWYDKNVKWVVDIDFYLQRLHTEQIKYIPDALINVGISDQQVTVDCRFPEVEIPENFYLLNKIGIEKLRHVLVYDAWWRLLRNFSIHKPEAIRAAGYQGPIHPVLLSMIRWQKNIPASLLKIGPFSKSLMFLHFCLHRHLLKNS